MRCNRINIKQEHVNLTGTWQQVHESGNRAYSGGLYDAALRNYEQALELARRSGDTESLSETLRALAKTNLELGHVEPAVSAAREAEAIDREFWGFENPQVGEDMFVLAEALRRHDEFAEAKDLFERVYQLRVMFFGQTHESTLEVLVRLIWIDLQEDNLESLSVRIKMANELFAVLHPAGSFTNALNLKRLIKPYADRGRQQETALFSQRIEQALLQAQGVAHAEVRHVLEDTSEALKESNKPMAAWHAQSRARTLEQQESRAHWSQQDAHPVEIVQEIPVIAAQTNIDLARENAQKIVEQRKAGNVAGEPSQSALPWQDLCDRANKALASGMYDSALELFLSALATARRSSDDSAISETQRQLAKLYLNIDRPIEAELSASEAASKDRMFWGEENAFLAEDEFLLADAQRRRGFYTKARALLDRVARIRTKLFGEYHDETLAAQMRMIWITLQQKKEAELVKQIEQTRQGFEKKHRSCGFCEFLDIASLLRPYIADKARAEVTAICQMILSAIRTVYGIGHDEARWMSAECKTLIAALGAEEGPEPGEAEGVQENLSSAGSGARVAGAGAVAHLSASPAISGDAPKPGERFEVSEEEEPIDSASRESFAPPGLLQLALNLGGIDLESSVFLYLWLGAGTLFGALAVGTYVLSGNFFLILEPFTSAFLCITLLVWFSVSLMIVIRQDQLSRQLPDALDILASTMNAGNSMIESMDHLSQTLAPPLKLEFQRAMKSVRSGKSIYYAISELKSHVNVVQLEHLANSIRTSKSSGTGLVKQLTTLARELREKEKERLLMRRHLNTALQIGGSILISTVCFLLSVSFNPAFGAAVLGSLNVRLLLFCILGILAAGIIYAKNPSRNFSAGSAAIVADAKQIASEYDKAGRLRAELSTFLDLVVMHVQAGAPAPAAVQKVCNEARSSCPTLCGELSVLLENATSFKMAVPNALRTVGQRYGVEELLVLSSTLEASARLGGSISYQLIEQSEALRHRLAKTKQGRAASVSTVAIVIVVAIMMIWEMIAALLRGH